MNQTTRTRATSSSSSIQKKGIRKYSSDYYDSDASDSEPIVKKRVVKIWTPDEDEMLQQFYEQFKGNWALVAQSIPGRNASQCSQRWKRINPNRTKLRKQWTEEEDRQVIRLIQKFGKNWKRIENEMTGRSGKQIRERFINKLDKTINHEPFTEEEDSKIYNLYEKMGAKWSEISKLLEGRPENMVKNRFYSHIKKIFNIQIRESDSEGKEVIAQQQKQQNNSAEKQQEYNCNGEKKLDTIQSQFDYENSLKNNLENHNILFPNGQSFLKVDSLNSNGEFQLFGHHMSLEQKQLYGLDSSGSHIYQDIQLPCGEMLLDDQEQIIKKASNYLRSDNDNGENQFVYQFTKMSLEQE